jgi:hypothetical protein
MTLLGWRNLRNVPERSGSLFTTEGVNTITKLKVVLPWDLNFWIKSCAVLGTK